MHRLDLYKNADFGADKETWLFLQSQTFLLQELIAVVGDTYILSGLEGEDSLSDGYIVYQGELLPFKGGTKEADCVLVEQAEDAVYRIDADKDGEYDEIPTYKRRYACFASRTLVAGETIKKKFAFSDIKPFRKLLDLQQAATPVGGIMLWSGTPDTIPLGWYLCDGTHGTPDLRDRFVVGAGKSYKVADQGGADQITLTPDQLPAHTHKSNIAEAGSHSHNASTDSAGYHSHSGSTYSGGSHSHSYQDSYYIEQFHGDYQSEYVGSGYLGSAKTDRDNQYIWYRNRNTDSNGSHSHSLDINSAGSHSHTVSVSSNGSHTHTVTLDNTGGGQAHENRPPYYALAYIMFKGL